VRERKRRSIYKENIFSTSGKIIRHFCLRNALNKLLFHVLRQKSWGVRKKLRDLKVEIGLFNR
jgi:hypothetical protein